MEDDPEFSEDEIWDGSPIGITSWNAEGQDGSTAVLEAGTHVLCGGGEATFFTKDMYSSVYVLLCASMFHSTILIYVFAHAFA
jgi:hypothetical protein